MTSYSQVGRAEETYAAGYVCHACRGTFFGGVSRDPSRPGEYPLSFRFCPCCGVAFAGEVKRSEATERRRELRCEAGWKSHHAAEAGRITYRLQRLPDGSGRWEEELGYYAMYDRAAVASSWRERLAQGSWFGESVRLVARTAGGEKVVFGPAHLEPNSHRETS